MQLAPYTFTRLTLSVLLLSACGGEPGTSATDSASGASTSGASTSTSASTGEPITTGTSEPDPTTSGASESATGSTSTGSTSTGSTGPQETSTGSTGPLDSSTGDAESSTGLAESSTTSDDTTGAIMDCPTLEKAFNAETLKIRSCKQPSECGVELPMTSCGCTRNWVARKDADTKPFYDLLAQGQELECELIGPSTCDCPAAEGFTCTQNICTWNYL